MSRTHPPDDWSRMPKTRFLPPCLIGVTLMLCTQALAQASPPQATYCAPMAFRDRVTPWGFLAVIRAAPGCEQPAKVRKINFFTRSVIGEPNLVPVGQVTYIWAFTHKLQYTLDGRTWQRLVIR